MKKLSVAIAILTETKKKRSGSESLGTYGHLYSGVSKDKRGTGCRQNNGVIGQYGETITNDNGDYIM